MEHRAPMSVARRCMFTNPWPAAPVACGSKPYAIIAHHQLRWVKVVQTHLHPGGLGVLQYVVERLLEQPEEHELAVGRGKQVRCQ
jgi:hypothetical protein